MKIPSNKADSLHYYIMSNPKCWITEPKQQKMCHCPNTFELTVCTVHPWCPLSRLSISFLLPQSQLRHSFWDWLLFLNDPLGSTCNGLASYSETSLSLSSLYSIVSASEMASLFPTFYTTFDKSPMALVKNSALCRLPFGTYPISIVWSVCLTPPLLSSCHHVIM